MRPWTLIDSAPLPGSETELTLHSRDGEYAIRIGNNTLMGSRAHGSEDALAEMTCDQIASRPKARMLIGGLGMGYTLATALGRLGKDAEVVVAELVPAVVEWNETHLSHLAGHPLRDERSRIAPRDVAREIRATQTPFDAILLDVDNGPDDQIRDGNGWLYAREGLQATYHALRPGGVLAVWSAGPDESYRRRLDKAGFRVKQVTAGAGRDRRGPRHTIWFATRPTREEVRSKKKNDARRRPEQRRR